MVRVIAKMVMVFAFLPVVWMIVGGAVELISHGKLRAGGQVDRGDWAFLVFVTCVLGGVILARLDQLEKTLQRRE